MRLAVVIPCYNHARYVGDAIRSALQQTRKPDRILVIDDGSQDESVEVIRGWEKEGVAWRARENRGAHETINELVEWASADCEVVSILNSDDEYVPERFAHCLPELEQREDMQVVVTGLQVIDGAGEPAAADSPRGKWFRAIWSLWDGPETDLCHWLGVGNFPATTSNVVARTSWLQRFPFRPYRFNHDYSFLAQSVLRGALTVRPEELVRYRVHGTNTMNTSPAALLREMLRMNLDLARDLGPELMKDPDLREAYRRYRRGCRDSISGFSDGLFQAMQALVSSRWSESELAEMTRDLDPEDFRELQAWPNKALVNEWQGSGPVTAGVDLANQHDQMRQEIRERKSRERTLRESGALRAALLQSRWLAAGRVLGFWKPPGGSRTTADELTAALLKQRWVRLGRKMGMLRNHGRPGPD